MRIPLCWGSPGGRHGEGEQIGEGGEGKERRKEILGEWVFWFRGKSWFSLEWNICGSFCYWSEGFVWK